MEHGAAAVERLFRLLAQPREVCGKNRGCQFDGHGQRAAPSFPRRKQIIRGSSSMPAEKCESNQHSQHGIAQCFWLLSRANSSMRMTSKAYSGVTASAARPTMTSRKFE